MNFVEKSSIGDDNFEFKFSTTGEWFTEGHNLNWMVVYDISKVHIQIWMSFEAVLKSWRTFMDLEDLFNMLEIQITSSLYNSQHEIKSNLVYKNFSCSFE